MAQTWRTPTELRVILDIVYEQTRMVEHGDDFRDRLELVRGDV
jgi:hypothetical protein